MEVKSIIKVKSNLYESKHLRTGAQPLGIGSQSEFVHVAVKWNFVLVIKESIIEENSENILSFEQGGPLSTLLNR